MTSFGSSTTQTTRPSLRGLLQMAHGSVSAKFQQVEHKSIFSLTLTRAFAIFSTSSLGNLSIYRAIRWADFRPIPGSCENSSISWLREPEVKSTSLKSWEIQAWNVGEQPGSCLGYFILGH